MIADDLSRISMSAGLATTVSRAVDYARGQGHQDVLLEHMLMALCDDSDAALVLAASNIDVARLRADVADYLAGVERRVAPHGQTFDPVVSTDLLRILEAAAAAARGGKRREINGAIVLAAIIGDGKSPAAHFMRAQGLTFEGAIRALQTSRQAPAPATAGDILANARERVQARTRGPVYPAPQAEAVPAPPSPPEPESEPDLDEVYAEIGEPIEEVEEAQPAAFAPGAGGSEWNVSNEQHYQPAYEEHDDAQSVEEAGYEDEPPQLPASAPFPPPLPVPGAPDLSPAPALRDFGPLAAAAHSPPSLPPVPSARHPSSVPWPDVMPELPGVGSSDTRRPRVEGIGAAADHRPTLAERARRFEQGGDRAPSAPPPPPPLGASRTPSVPQGARPAGARVRAEVGQLVENIPRSMRVAVPVLVEARIARADVQNLSEGMRGAAQQHEIKITRVMSVSLRAPDGGFFIESASPETQFIDGTHSLSADDFASWRWHVTPREKGKKRLQLVISGRAVADGIIAETALPDQVISVRVRTNYGRSFARGFGWVVAAVVGGLIARFGEGVFDAGLQTLSHFIHK
ncbi:MAG: Clp protease N-terminal domain-containing protein [Hyphomicrobium sp.]